MLVPRRFGLRRKVTVSADAPEVSTSASYDILSVAAVEERFGIQMLSYDNDGATVAKRMPVQALANPLTGEPTIGRLPVLVDDAGGTVAFALRPRGLPVTSELSLRLHHGALRTVERSVGDYRVSRAHVVDVTAYGALSVCRLSVGTGKSVPRLGGWYTSTETYRPTGVPTRQWTNLPVVAGSAASSDGLGQKFWSGSLHVNFLWPCAAGRRSRYVARVAQERSTVTVAEARALGGDGNTAVTARLTVYKTH